MGDDVITRMVNNIQKQPAQNRLTTALHGIVTQNQTAYTAGPGEFATWQQLLTTGIPRLAAACEGQAGAAMAGTPAA